MSRALDVVTLTGEDCRADRVLNAEMKRLWNAQTPNAELCGARRASEPTPGYAGDNNGE